MDRENMFDGLFVDLGLILTQPPEAIAMMNGVGDYEKIRGKVEFFQTGYGTVVATEIRGLPYTMTECKRDIFAFHIHDGAICAGNENDPLAYTMSHYNPNNCEHPYHAGDLPPVWSNNGYAMSVTLTDRFNVNEVIGKTVILHSQPDDFHTQPSGNSGMKIACGQIEGMDWGRRYERY